MTNLALTFNAKIYRQLFWVVSTLLATMFIARFGVTLNQFLALLLSAIVLIIWSIDKPNGLIASLIFFFVKPLFIRIAYEIDSNLAGAGGFDLLGVTPALLLATLIVWYLYMKASSGEKIVIGRTRLWLSLFSAIAFLAIFNPANSIIVGFGGFERNVLPNMMVLLLASFVFAEKTIAERLLKSLVVIGIISSLYAIGQFVVGVYPWEKRWLLEVAFAESSAGWLTVGLRGVEFRLFSFFFNYMDFTFSNVIIFALALATRQTMSKQWKKITLWYLILWFAVLLVSLERTPLLMSLTAVAVVYFLKSDNAKRKRLIWKTVAIASVFFLSMSLISPVLKNTGADKLIRLAELANPLSAASISDRMERKWGPAMKTIAANPLGVGTGYGSQTRANSVASQSEYWVEPHNELLQKTLETGIIGGLVFLLLLISVYRDSLRLSHSRESIGKLGIGFAGATVGFWLCGMVNVPFSGSSGLLYWALAGVVLAMSEKAKKPEQTADIS